MNFLFPLHTITEYSKTSLTDHRHKSTAPLISVPTDRPYRYPNSPNRPHTVGPMIGRFIEVLLHLKEKNGEIKKVFV